MGEVVEHQTTVFEYFTDFRNIQLQYSGDFPCINVGKPKRPTYIPIEVNSISSFIPLPDYACTVHDSSCWFFILFSAL